MPDRSGESNLQIFESACQLQLVKHRQVHAYDYETADKGCENACCILSPVLVHLGGHAEQGYPRYVAKKRLPLSEFSSLMAFLLDASRTAMILL